VNPKNNKNQKNEDQIKKKVKNQNYRSKDEIEKQIKI
jgi:hypothetical protein